MRRQALILTLLAVIFWLAACTAPMEYATPTPTGTPTPTPRPTTTPMPTATPVAYPMRLRLVGQFGGPVNALALSGDLAYLAVGPRLVVVDVSNPRNPLEVGRSAPLADQAVSIAALGEYALVSENEGPLWVYDVSDPTQPRPASSLDVGDTVVGIVVTGEIAYLAAGEAGLVAVELSSTSTLNVIGQFVPQGVTRQVVISDNLAIVYTGVGTDPYAPENYSVISVVDVSNPAQLVELSATRNTSHVGEITTGNMVIIWPDGQARRGFDLTDPSHPSYVEMPYDSFILDIDIVGSGQYLYGLSAPHDASDYDLMVEDLNDTSHIYPPVPVVPHLDAFANGDRIAVRGNLVYTADPKGLDIYDVSSPPQRRLMWPPDETDYYWTWEPIGSYRADYGTINYVCCIPPFERFHASSGYLYFWSNSAPFFWTLEDPANPVLALYQSGRPEGFVPETLIDSRDGQPTWGPGFGQIWENSWDVKALHDDLFFVSHPIDTHTYQEMGDAELQIYDVSNPQNPQLIGSYAPIPNDGHLSVEVVGDYAYVYPVNYGYPSFVIDISDPTHPVETDDYPRFFMNRIFILANSLVYTIRNGDLYIFSEGDLTTPLSITAMGSRFGMSGVRYANDSTYMALADNRVYVVPGGSTDVNDLYVVDVQNPEQPRVLAAYDSVLGRPWSVVADGDYLYLEVWGYGIVILHLIPQT